MVQARREFLAGGHYAGLAAALAEPLPRWLGMLVLGASRMWALGPATTWRQFSTGCLRWLA